MADVVPDVSPKAAKPGVTFFGLLLSVVLALTLIALSGFMDAASYKYLKLAFIIVFALSHINILVSLSFESFRRYSRFGISHTKKVLNHILSVTLVALPFISIVIPVLVVPSLLLLSLSKFRSPDNVAQGRPLYKKDGFYEIMKAALWTMAALFVFFAP